ncbi:MAG: hypothetical protein U5L96_19130 [Owenweeksia sp.]|nr:hypothetical protein [Owenweeksia sp.]
MSTICIAKPYAKIEDSHDSEGCTYYDVVIYDDNGTADTETDDYRLSGGTINDCDRVVHGEDSSRSNTKDCGHLHWTPKPGVGFITWKIAIAERIEVIGTGGAGEDGCI